MLRLLVFIASVVNAKSVWTGDNCEDHLSKEHSFCNYMRKHNKTYFKHNWRERQRNIETASLYIKKHNEKPHEYDLQLTTMSDLSNPDFVKQLSPIYPGSHVKGRKLRQSRETDIIQQGLKNIRIPPSFDWRQHSSMTAVSTQGHCGSCFAIVAGEMMDWWNNKLVGTAVKTTASVQQLMDCSSDEFPDDAERCKGSVMEYPLRYAQHNRVWHTQDYPYERHGDICKHKKPHYKTVHPVLMHHTDRYDENDLEQYLPAYIYHYGPVGVSFDASDPHFQHLGGGIYKPGRCSDSNVNHAVLVVGYTPEFYIVKNSWGPHYSENGYFRIKRGRNLCGMLEVVSILMSARLK